MDNLELNSKLLTYISLTLSTSWFALNLDMIVGIITIIALISAIIANVARIKRDNSARRISELDQLNKELDKNNDK